MVGGGKTEENEKVTKSMLETREAYFLVSPTFLLPFSSSGPDCIFNKHPLFSSPLLSTSSFSWVTSQLEQWDSKGKERKTDSG